MYDSLALVKMMPMVWGRVGSGGRRGRVIPIIDKDTRVSYSPC